MPTNLDQQIECAARELKMRKRVYARRVMENKMTDDDAEFEKGCMSDIIESLKELQRLKGERLL
jgi:chorismate mutase